MANQTGIKGQIAECERRLQILRQQRAKYGELNVPPHIVTEIEDTQAELERLQIELMGVFPAQPTIYHNLPQPDYGRFVGREAELAKVARILRPYPHSQHALVTIDGIGGIGKSALALEIAHRYLRNYNRTPPEERFEAIIWTSAKQTVLTGEGIKSRRQVLRTLDDIYTAIAVALQREDITRARPEEQDEVVRRALTCQRTLLIVDNLETVDDEAVLEFLRELPAPTKAIVTTRHRIDVAYPVRLVGMPWEDGRNLIAQEAEKKGVNLTTDETRRLYERTGGVPLAIVWSVAQMGFGYGVEAVLVRLGQPTGDIARFCFEGAVEGIRGRPAHKLLMALSLFATDASREALGYVADLPELDRDDGLVELEKLSLVNKRADRFSSLPLTRAYSTSELEQEARFSRIAFERIVAFYRQLLTIPPEKRLGDPYWNGLTLYTQAEFLQQEMENLLHIIRRVLELENERSALELFLPIVHLLQILGLWDERLELSQQMCRAARKLDDPAEAWLWIDAIGYLHRERQLLEEFTQALDKGRALARKFNLVDASILADAHQAHLYARLGSDDLAQSKIEQALEQVDLSTVLETGTRLRRLVSARVTTVMAHLSGKQKNFVRQKELYELERDLRGSYGENTTPALNRLAYIQLRLNDITAAEKTLDEAALNAGSKDWPWIHLRRAKIAYKRNDVQEARRLGELACDQFALLGQKLGLCECQKFLARLAEYGSDKLSSGEQENKP